MLSQNFAFQIHTLLLFVPWIALPIVSTAFFVHAPRRWQSHAQQRPRIWDYRTLRTEHPFVPPTQRNIHAILLLAKAKRGKLASNVNLDDVRRRARTNSAARSKKKSGRTTDSSSSSDISPLLAQWAANASPNIATTTTTTPNKNKRIAVKNSSSAQDEGSGAAYYESFDGENDGGAKQQRRRSAKKCSTSRTTPRQSSQRQRDERAAQLITEFLNLVESSSDSKKKTPELDELLDPIKQLVCLPLPTEQCRAVSAGTISSSNKKLRTDYRLAWVGSDDAVSHIGTGLHKVPLARLQEVFLSLPGRNRVELLEVIRVLGPFPNVKNVLQGTSTLDKKKQSSSSTSFTMNANTNFNEDMVEWKVTWESMVDGTGKELMAGKQENIRNVILHIYFCSNEVLVAAVPPVAKGSITGDPSSSSTLQQWPDWLFEESGRNLLIFVKEDDLDLQLDKYRVAAV